MLTAETADVAQTNINTTYLSLMNLLENLNVLYICTTGTFVHTPKHLKMCISILSDAPKDTFKEYASDPHQTMKYRICDCLGVRKCAS